MVVMILQETFRESAPQFCVLPPITYWTQGMYAGEVGAPRLLKLFERFGIKTTWFIPGGFPIPNEYYNTMIELG